MPDKPRKRRASVRSIARFYLQALYKRPWLFALVIGATFVIQVAELTAPLYLKQIFNHLGAGVRSPEVMTSIFAALLILCIVYFITWIGRRTMTFSLVLFETRSMADLFSVAFDYLIAHSQHFFSSQFTGTLTRRVSKFGYAFEAIVDFIVFQLVPTTIFVAGAVTILYLRNHTLGLVLGGWAIGMFILQVWLARLRQPLRELQSEEDSKMAGALADAISNQSTIVFFSGIQHELARFRDSVLSWKKATLKSWMGDEYIWAILGFLMFAVEVVLLYLAVGLWGQGLLQIGDFILIQAYLFSTFDRVIAINRDLRRFYTAIADASEMVEILEEPYGVADLPGATTLTVSKGDVSFTDVEFGFAEGAKVLQDLSLSVSGGEKVALVGPSGAGKSTVTKLLLRLYDVTSGAVEIDGQNVRGVSQASLREAIGFVPQEPILFHRTLMENIRYGRRDATDDEVIAAAKKAHAHEFIQAFPDKYETYVGERGVRLSGGERQRVAIARAILKNAPILVLDEATSSLDSESEHYIQEALDILMEGKTVIVIAHRLSTIMKMDRIIVMEDGSVVATGTHDELLAEKGLYHKLWSIQAGGFLGGEEESVEEETQEGD